MTALIQNLQQILLGDIKSRFFRGGHLLAQAVHRLSELADGGGCGIDIHYFARKFFTQTLKIFLSSLKIHLVGYDHGGAFGEPGHIELKLVFERIEILERVSSVNSAHIQDVTQHRCTLDVTQKCVS